MIKTISFQLLLIFILLPNVLAVQLTEGKSEGMVYQVHEVAKGFGIPWGMAFLQPELLLITERQGSVKLLNITSGKSTTINGVPEVWANGQGGMLDVAAPDDYKPGDWLYFTYSKDLEGKGATVLARARLEDDTVIDWQDLLVTQSTSDTGRHFGSRITFDGQGHIFFSVGDRGVRPNGQDRQNHAGTIIRLNLDGTVPTDNPFVAGEGLPEIWSYGHRNPQGLFWEKSTSTLWSNEHGPRGGDEINVIEKGKNYGWPVVSHGKEYWGPVSVGEATSKPGMVDPVKVFTPSIAPGSLLVYSGKLFPAWRGNLFAGALALTHLNRVVVGNSGKTREERLLLDLDERIRNVVESPEGMIYVSTDSGRILRLQPPTETL